MPYTLEGKIAVDGSLRDLAGQYIACDWADVQLEVDGGDVPWCGMFGTIPVELDAQRTMKRAGMGALCMALVRLHGPANKNADN